MEKQNNKILIKCFDKAGEKKPEAKTTKHFIHSCNSVQAS